MTALRDGLEKANFFLLTFDISSGSYKHDISNIAQFHERLVLTSETWDYFILRSDNCSIIMDSFLQHCCQAWRTKVQVPFHGRNPWSTNEGLVFSLMEVGEQVIYRPDNLT